MPATLSERPSAPNRKTTRMTGAFEVAHPLIEHDLTRLRHRSRAQRPQVHRAGVGRRGRPTVLSGGCPTCFPGKCACPPALARAGCNRTPSWAGSLTFFATQERW